MSFTESIQATHRGPLARAEWVDRHNRAVARWARSPRTTVNDESVVLNHALAIWTLLRSRWGTDGYVQPNVTEPMMQALQLMMNGFHDALNISLGDLDGGTLSSWLCDLAERYQVEGVL